MQLDHAGSDSAVLWKLLATAVFVLLNGFFVAAEFALVKVRGTRVEASARRGHRRAQMTLRILGDLNLYLSACQLGITIASLILGWLAEPAVARLLIIGASALGFEVVSSPWVHVLALAIALSTITVLHMTIGEQAPKIWALRRPESIAFAIAYPLWVFTTVLRPFIWLVNGISNALLKLVGVSVADEHGETHDVGELRAILRASTRAGHISRRQRAFSENVLRLVRLQVRHIMLPRIDVAYLSTQRTVQENLAFIQDSAHSRYPFCDPDLDNVRGLVLSRDVLSALIKGEPVTDLSRLARPIPSVPDTQPLARMMLDLQRTQTHCALVVDEHGTTVGVAYLEDALEEIVGPIHDEFDQKSLWVSRPEENTIEMAGSVPLPEAAELLELDLGTEEDTIGGHVVSLLGRLPVEGDEISIDSYRVTVVTMSRRRVARLRFQHGGHQSDSETFSDPSTSVARCDVRMPEEELRR